MRKAGFTIYGFGLEGTRDDSVREGFVCKHCQKNVVVPYKASPTELGGRCHTCDGLICPNCVRKLDRGELCETWEKAMERMEAREAARRSYGL